MIRFRQLSKKNKEKVSSSQRRSIIVKQIHIGIDMTVIEIRSKKVYV